MPSEKIGLSLVACFPNGLPSLPAPDDNGISEAELKLQIYRNTLQNKQSQRIAVLRDKRGDFKGSNYGSESSSHDPYKYVIGVRSKETGKMTVLDVPHVYRLFSFRTGMDQSEEDPAAQADAERNALVKRRDLTATFGSARSQRMERAMDRALIATGGASASTSSAADGPSRSRAEKRKLTAREELDKGGQLRTFIPTYNPDATTPEDVYPLSSLVSEEDLACLNFSEYLKILMKAYKAKENAYASEVLNENRFPSYVVDRLVRLRSEDKQDGPPPPLTVQLLLYLACLIVFFNEGRVIPQKAEVLARRKEMPEMLVRKFLDTFTEKQSSNSGLEKYVRTPGQTDLLISSILVMCLKVDHHRLHTDKIAADLGFTPAVIAKHLTNLGCTSASRSGPGQAGSREYRLTVPLSFPQNRLKKRK